MASYEERMIEARNKEIALRGLVKGEKVDITKSEDLFFQVNKDRMSLEDFVNRDRFVQDAKEMKAMKANLYDRRHGKTIEGKGRFLGEMPAEIYYGRKEFSDPNIPRAERAKNIKKFFNDFPAFRTGDGKL